MEANRFTSVIIPAGGKGSRMKTAENKLLMRLGQKTVIEYTVSAFDNAETVDEIIVVLPDAERKIFENIIKDTVKNKTVKFAKGGISREHSVYNGFKIIDKNCEFVSVHDAARPLISTKEIDEINRKAYKNNCVCAGNSVKNTIKIIDTDNRIKETLNRSALFSAATPQVFKKEIFQNSFEKFKNKLSEFTDDSSVIEAAGYNVEPFYCDEKNIKITTIEDIKTAEKFLNL